MSNPLTSFHFFGLICAFGLMTSLPIFAGESTATLEGTIMQSKGAWVLRLPARISVTQGDETGVTRDVQLVGLSQVGALLINNLDGKEVRLNGRLALAHTRYHVEPVLFIVSDKAIRKLAAVAGAEE